MIRFICWVALAPINRMRRSRTTTGFRENFVFGFFVTTLTVPFGLTSILFHIMSDFVLGKIYSPRINSSGKMFIVAPRVYHLSTFLHISVSDKFHLMALLRKTFPAETTTLPRNLTSEMLALFSRSRPSFPLVRWTLIFCLTPLLRQALAKWFFHRT